MASSVKPARIGSSPGTSLDALRGPDPSAPRRWPWIVVALVVLILAGFTAVGVRLVHSVDTFALTLELKVPEGKRVTRVTGTDVVIEQHPRKGTPVSTSCVLGLQDALRLQSLSRAKLVEDGLGGRPSAGTFMTTIASTGEVSNGDLDDETAATMNDFILKHAAGCVQLP